MGITLNVRYKNSSVELNYDLSGVSKQEFDQLSTEFTSADYSDYNGVFAPYYVVDGMELILYMGDKFEAKELTKYKEKFHPACTEAAPYRLNDGRVMLMGPMYASVFDSEAAYLQSNRKKIFNQRRIPKNDFPIKRIAYLADGNKIYYHEIDRLDAELLMKMYAKLSEDKHPVTHKHTAFYQIGKNRVLELKNGFYKIFYNLYQQHDFDRLVEKWKTDEQRKSAQAYLIPQLCGRNPLGELFLDEIENLINSLPKLLNIPSGYDGFPIIQRYIYANLITDELADQIFLPLLAYTGHFLTTKGAKWEMIYDKYWNSWTPDVSYNGQNLEIYRPLLKMLDSTLVDQEAITNLQAYVNITVRKMR